MPLASRSFQMRCDTPADPGLPAVCPADTQKYHRARNTFAMFFRFAASLILVVLISMIGIGLEKRSLNLKRAVSRQYYQEDVLLELHARQRLKIQQLTAPVEIAAQQAGSAETDGPQDAAESAARPQMRWNNPAALRQ